MGGDGEEEGTGKGEGTVRRGRGRKGEGTRPHPFTPPLIHISGYPPDDYIQYNSAASSEDACSWKQTDNLMTGVDFLLHYYR